MIGVDEIKRFMELVVLTGYLKDEKPLSLFLVGKPETGKSSLISSMRGYPNTLYFNDLSYKGFIEEVVPLYEKGQKTHILIPDFINVLSHKRASDALIPALNSVMQEGLDESKFYGSIRRFDKTVYMGVITGITKEMFDTRIILWRNIGFLTRMLVATYGYTNETRVRIHEHIRNGKGNEKEKPEKDFSRFRQESLIVHLPPDIAEKIELLASTVAYQTSRYLLWIDGAKREIDLTKYGFRLHQQLRALVKASALYNERRVEGKDEWIVSGEDVKDIVNLSKFMNFDFTNI